MRILFAEDDRDLSRAVTALLSRSGYSVKPVYDGAAAVEAAGDEDFDAIIMDWMMPVTDGIEALRQLRASGDRTPCLILTARGAVSDRIAGLDSGADDYLTKPFDFGELQARLRAMLRRGNSWQSDTIRLGDTILETGSMEIRFGEKHAPLHTKEFQLLSLLMRDPGVVFSTDRILDRVWGSDSEVESNIVSVYISRLRKQLKDIGADIRVAAVRGSGYRVERL